MSSSKEASSDSKKVGEKEWSLKGWNWGSVKFNGPLLTFEVSHKPAFEIPLDKVSQCMTGRSEVTIEFHQNNDDPVSLMEMRFHIPPAEIAGATDPVEEFHDQVMQKASVVNISGDAIAIFREIPCVTPRGRYDIKMFQTFFQLHGKTFDYKIPMSTVRRLFLLPHKDGRQKFFVVSLDPPIKQGQTRYPYIVFTFNTEDEEISIELPLSEEELKDKYDGKLAKELSGHTYDVLGSIMKAITNNKITTPGSFIGASGTPAVSCSYKAAAGYIYPLERGFMFVHKPPLHIRFEEIASVNFARGAGSMTRSFDFEVLLKSGLVHTFSSIDKGEYGKLFDYVSGRKLVVKDSSKSSSKVTYKENLGDSEDEDEPDAYLARVKREAKERDDDAKGGGGGDDDDDESDDEDFNPNQEESDVAEEYDSNPSTTSESGEDSDSKSKKKKKKDKKKKRKDSDKDDDDEVSLDDEDEDEGGKKSKKKPKDTKKRKPTKEKEPKEKKKKAPAKKGGTEYKSKEFIEEEDSSDSDKS